MRKLFIFLCLFVSLGAHSQSDGIYIKVTDANVKKSLLALTPLQYTGSASLVSQYQKIGADLYSVLRNDLDVSSYFEFINPKAYLEDTAKVGLRPAPQYANGFKFDNWKKIGSEFLIRAGYQVVAGKIELESYLYYVPTATLVVAKKYTGSIDEARTIAHTFANDIILNLTKKPGMFTSQLVVTSDRAGNKWKEIYTMDWDGYNAKKITNHKSIAVSPNWSYDGKSITYTAFAYNSKTKSRNADLFLFELDTQKRFALSTKAGINSGSSFTPDDKNIYLTISQGGNPDIYRMDTNGRNQVRLTNGPAGAMNVEPEVNKDGDLVVFSSDRSGNAMIYTMNTSGSNVKRLTFAGKYNASPVWSPDGKKIAFAGFDKTHFDIFVMNADGTNMIRLTSAKKKNGKMANNENPSFSPDGRLVMYVSDRTGKKQIYIANADGTNERRITFDNYNYDQPKWSKK
ncbi:MAG: PD40 domain-containing protein [Bdellovibrionales bacterium]|nr:PD40 domain-containing protein [Bdellovibrionales bacterium]